MFSWNIMRSTFLVILSLLVLTSCASKNQELKEKKVGLYFSAGMQNLMDKQYTDALKNFLKANELEPNNSEILNNLGMSYYFKGEKDLAIKTLKQALKLNEDNSDARVNLASIYFQEKKFNEAEKTYKMVLKDLTYDKQTRTFYNLGVLELNYKKDSVAAENYFRKSIKEDDNYCPSYFQLGLIQYNRKQLKNALKNFKEASMGDCYESPAPHYYQALALIDLGRFDEARLKLDEVDTHFKKSVFAVKARAKSIELSKIENRKSSESHASRNVLESPDF
jgi:tetratricopeptide (TPR) repeat protein